MRLGIKRKILLVLTGVLALSTVLYALLASYYTNSQHQELAFGNLSRDLSAWQDDLNALTLRTREAALAASGDVEFLDQLTELITTEMGLDDATRFAMNSRELARTAAYSKSVSLNRLYLVLRTGGFSSISVYISGRLSHFISASEAGMMVRRGNTGHTWLIASADANGNLPLQHWPAWREGLPQASVAAPVTDPRQTIVSFEFPGKETTAIQITVPVQGMLEEVFNDIGTLPKSRFVSELKIADTIENEMDASKGQRSRTFAILVFQRQLGRTYLQEIAKKTGKSPVLFSFDGTHRQQLAAADLVSNDLLQQAQAARLGTPIMHGIVDSSRGSFYEALLPWQFNNQTHLILGLTSSRDNTLQNIRQTVSAILILASAILVLCIGIGIFWVRRFIDPITALTAAVNKVRLKRQSEGGAEGLQPITIYALDEIGELSVAFNAMIIELRQSFEMLEQRVQARTAELRQQTLYLRTLIDTLPLWVWLKDTQNHYLAVNQKNAEACGRTVDEMVGKSDLELWPSALAERYQAEDAEVIAKRQRVTVEQAFPDVNGGTVWMEIYRTPVLDEDGTVLGTVGAARNISERKAAEEAREKALAEAVRLARQRSEFLAQMSHELRTPLNAILGYAQILRHDKHLTERQATGLATIQESGQHLLTLINDILDLARIEANKLELSLTAVDLSSFLQVVANIMRVKADEKSLLYSYWVESGLPATVKVDDKRLRQVLLNLLGNAVKFTDRGEVTLRVQRASSIVEQSGGSMVRLRFEVEDSGIGMNEDQLARIFQPFEQVGEAQRREGGTGLGLAISQKLIRLMGGNIEVRSQPGKGSLFWFEVNLSIAEGGIVTQKEIPPSVIGYEGRRHRILIVDDVPQNRAMLMNALSPLGFGVFDASNGQECLDRLHHVEPDLVVMDVMMPIMGGLEATRQIRQWPDFARLPVIVVTASATVEDQTKSMAAGANAFLPKPVDLQSLLKTIGEILHLKWVYEDVQESLEEDESGLIIPPKEEIEILRHLAKMGNMRNIIDRADYLKNLDSRYAPFARRLHSLAAGYQSKAIVALVEKCRTA